MNMLAKVGITIGKGNKLELDEDALKQADIGSLKTVFTGYAKTDSSLLTHHIMLQVTRTRLKKQIVIFKKRRKIHRWEKQM